MGVVTPRLLVVLLGVLGEVTGGPACMAVVTTRLLLVRRGVLKD